VSRYCVGYALKGLTNGNTSALSTQGQDMGEAQQWKERRRQAP
jgi:hypothetical protein